MKTLEKRNEQILKFREKGWTVLEIAQRYKITDVRVYQIIAAQRRKAAKAA